MDQLKFKSFNNMNKHVHHRFKDLYDVVNVDIIFQNMLVLLEQSVSKLLKRLISRKI